MSGLSQEEENRIRIEDEFIELLLSTWTRRVACQNECHPPETCSCQRYIVHVDALKAWWRRKHSESPNSTKLHRVLDEIFSQAGHWMFVPEFQKLFTGEHSCLRVFSLLLKQGRGHLVDRFYDSDMNDKYLERSDSNQSLRDNLANVVHRDELDCVIQDFHNEKWAYCPLELTLHMGRNLQGTKVIPPFCHKIKLGDKGGTASIYWVAIQKDFISDDQLKVALQDSLFNDDDFGWCYQMVLKSYCGDKKSDFESEKEAFSGLQSDSQVPIVRYLGSYTHDYGEGANMGKTYNLLLEYGERDLYQSWADETNVPPVRAKEILRFWNSLFEVADAIRHVHHLEVPRGKGTLRYHGWHADIKPDNILSIRGRYKLADFGFSRFAQDFGRRDGSVPTELIRGFTDTYGAPEVSRMKRPDGTMSGVTQSIDAWSFGCVLSVAATWVVLGFQGIRQYEQLRLLSPANNKGPVQHDRFHDGTHVLPEIRKWHDYLRGHLRPSDTTTDLVLDLVEYKLLTEPSLRPDLEELCDKLHRLSKSASQEIESLKKPSRDTDAAVLIALLKIEEQAQSQRSSEPKTTPFQQQSAVATGVIRANPVQRASMQIQKERLIKSKPLGQTAYRMEILESELKTNRIIKEVDERTVSGEHNGATTDSPTDFTPSKDDPFIDRQTRPRNPELLDSFQANGTRLGNAAARAHAPRATRADAATTSFHRASNPPSDHWTTSNAVHFAKNGHLTQFYDHFDNSPESLESARTTIRAPDSPLARLSTAHGKSSAAPAYNTQSSGPVSDGPSSSTYYGVGNSTPATSPPHTPTGNIAGPSMPLKGSPGIGHKQNQNHVPRLTYPSPADSHFGDKRVYEPGVGTANLADIVSMQNPSITVSNSAEQREQMGTIYSETHVSEKETVEDQHTNNVHEVESAYPEPLPPSALDLPYDICGKRRDLDEQVTKGFGAKWKGKIGIETRARDASLLDTFSEPRELIFVVDNGWTMSKHWPIVTFVAETLAKNAAGLDKSGIDIKFTVDGSRHNKNDLKGDSGRRTLRKALKAAWPEYKQNDNAITDMARTFSAIFKEWHASGQRATTLLVLTDAVWAKTDPTTLHKTILAIAKHDQQNTGDRHFSIQFIRFGDSDTEEARLQWLDDGLCSDHKLRDIIDHCSWRASVDKMFKGSIEGFYDDKETDEKPVAYDYDQLVALFQACNEGSGGLLSPTQRGLQHTLSRSSSRSSTASSRWRDSAPVPTEHTPRRHSRMFSH